MFKKLSWGIGILLLAIGFGLFVYVFLFELRAEVTGGKIVEVIKKATGNNKEPWTFTPVVSYKVKEIAFFDTSSIYSNEPDYSIGKRYKVFYNRDDPEKAILGGITGYLGCIVVTGIGVIFISLAFIGYLIGRWKIETVSDIV